MKKEYLIGVLLAATAGVFWSSKGIAAEYLMRDFNFAALDLVSLRLLGLTLNAVELYGIALIFVMVVVITRPKKSA